jgi:hypothetical protein
MRSSPRRPFHPIYPFPFFLPPPFFGAEKPLACDRPVVRATAHRPAAAVPPRTTPGRPGWALPTDSSVTYYQRTTPDLRDESQSEGVRRGGNSPEHEAPTPRYSISSTSWTVCPLVIRYYLPLACRARADPPPQRWWWGGGNCQLSSTLCRRAGDGAAVRVQTSRPCLLARTYKCCRLLVSQLVWLAAQFGAAAARKLPLPLLVRPDTCPTYLLVLSIYLSIYLSLSSNAPNATLSPLNLRSETVAAAGTTPD